MNGTDAVIAILRYGIPAAFRLYEISQKDVITDEDWSELLNKIGRTKEEGVEQAKERLRARGISVD